VRSPLVVSSIGSVPVPLPGLPMKGELIDFEDWQTGRVRGLPNVFGLGNVLTGKGNIKESRKNSQAISTQLVQSYLGLGGERPLEQSFEAAHVSARERAGAAVTAAEAVPPLAPEKLAKVFEEVAAHWARSGYDGDYAGWIRKVLPRGEEA